MTDEEIRAAYVAGLGHEMTPLVPYNHKGGLRAVYDRGRAAMLTEVAPLLKLMAEPFCWERDWHPSSEGCGKCRHCRARALLRLTA